MVSTAAAGEGLYVAFEIGQERGLTQFVKGIPPSIGEPLDFTQLSITAMYPEELSASGLGRQERRQLPQLVRKIQRGVSHLAVVGSVLESNQSELVAHKKFAAIPVDPSDELVEARRLISEIVHRDMNIKVPDYNPRGWHVSVARRSRSGKRLAPYKKPMPERLVVSGATIAIRSAKSGENMRYVVDYMNVPRHTGRR